MRLSCYLLILITLFYSIAGFGSKDKPHIEPPTLQPTYNQFIRAIRHNYSFTPNLPMADLRKLIHKTEFLPIDYMRAGQVSFGFLTAEDKISRAAKEYDAEWDYEKGKWKFDRHNDKGRSLFPESKSALGILGPDGIYIVDGHHKILTSLYYGAQTYPITLIEDLSVDENGKPYPQNKFRELMIDRGHVFLTHINGKAAPWVPLLDKMANDPNRYFVTLITTKLKIKYKNGYAKIKDRKGSKEPLLVKIGRDSEFFELEFAKRLHAAGLHYQDIYRDQPPAGFIERVAQVLWDMRKAGDPFLQTVLMFPEAREISTEKLEVLVNEFLQENPKLCETLLSSADGYF